MSRFCCHRICTNPIFPPRFYFGFDRLAFEATTTAHIMTLRIWKGAGRRAAVQFTLLSAMPMVSTGCCGHHDSHLDLSVKSTRSKTRRVHIQNGIETTTVHHVVSLMIACGSSDGSAEVSSSMSSSTSSQRSSLVALRGLLERYSLAPSYESAYGGLSESRSGDARPNRVDFDDNADIKTFEVTDGSSFDDSFANSIADATPQQHTTAERQRH